MTQQYFNDGRLTEWRHHNGWLAQTNGHWLSIQPPDERDVPECSVKDAKVQGWLAAKPHCRAELPLGKLVHWLAKFGTFPEADFDPDEGGFAWCPPDIQLVYGRAKSLYSWDRWVIRDATLPLVQRGALDDVIECSLVPNEGFFGYMLFLRLNGIVAGAQCLKAEAEFKNDPFPVQWAEVPA